MKYVKDINIFLKMKKKRKKGRERCQNVTEKVREKKHQYHHERNENLIEYKRNYFLAHKK